MSSNLKPLVSELNDITSTNMNRATLAKNTLPLAIFHADDYEQCQYNATYVFRHIDNGIFGLDIPVEINQSLDFGRTIELLNTMDFGYQGWQKAFISVLEDNAGDMTELIDKMVMQKAVIESQHQVEIKVDRFIQEIGDDWGAAARDFLDKYSDFIPPEMRNDIPTRLVLSNLLKMIPFIQQRLRQVR